MKKNNEQINENIMKIKDQPESIQQLIDLGKIYLQKHDILEARYYFLNAINQYPDKVDGYLSMGMFAYKDNNLDVAHDYFNQAIDIDEENINAWLGLAKINLKLTALTSTKRYIKRALKLAPKNPEVLLIWGVYNFLIHKYGLSEKILLQVVSSSKNETFLNATFYLGLLYAKQREFMKAASKFRHLSEIETYKDRNLFNDAVVQNNLGVIEFQLGNYDKAEEIFKNLLVRKTTFESTVLMNLAQMYWIQDKIDDAVKSINQAHNIDVKIWPWMQELNEYLQTGEEGLANKIKSLLKHNPDGLNLSMYLGCVIPNRYPFIEAASRHVLDFFEIGIQELEGASCCPAPGVFRSFDFLTWYVVGARNITLSEKLGVDMCTMCNGCYGTLNDVNWELKENKSIRDEVNQKLKDIDREFKGSINVRHIIDVFYNSVGVKEIKKKIVNPMKLNVAVHYGCHLLKPSFNKPWKESSEAPTFFDELVEITGAKSIPYKDKMMCCGAGGAVRGGMKEVSLDFTYEKLLNMRKAGVDIIVVCCPFCHLQFDLGQIEINSIYKDKIAEPFKIPVIYYTQLLGLALGMDPFKLGLLKTPKGKGVPPFIPVESIFSRYIEQIDWI
ncbi:CoB--CoM heterodisulfide reductase subunit B [Promethearchaeum syntrophicum]|uniref:CoB--CoM heterodisulfide reductase subunit B n=1 Tax=Promethearchaeum syntrophicum TaxID=2594042 RepID=A0A5B9DDK0_9ARCH|nr:CoB--CoM heterodisulfide reductase subunit B [Candidatus Prometheoarchaeum syntrophicum]QEE17389.1 CoB--CoM heterodisulfide reductase subunit B [Candidatus Prometheoarchaeum syntrophicum]